MRGSQSRDVSRANLRGNGDELLRVSEKEQGVPMLAPSHVLEREAHEEADQLVNQISSDGLAAQSRDLISGFEDLRIAAQARYGRELSNVSLSESSASKQAASSLAAHAFTIGQQIHMGNTGQTPTERLHTAAHEMVHAIQQTGGAHGVNNVTASPAVVARQEVNKKQPLIVDPALQQILKDNGLVVEPQTKNEPQVYVIPGSGDPRKVTEYINQMKKDNPLFVPPWAKIDIQSPMLPFPFLETKIYVTAFPATDLAGNKSKPEKQPAKPKPKPTAGQTAYWHFSQQSSAMANQLGVTDSDQMVHAIQPGVLDKYPGVFSEQELNDVSNLRGLGDKSAQPLHRQVQWYIWQECYKNLDAALREKKITPNSPNYKTVVRTYIESYRDGMDYQYGSFYTNNPHPDPSSFFATKEGRDMRSWSNKKFMEKGMVPKQLPDDQLSPWEQKLGNKKNTVYKPIYHPDTGDHIGYFYESGGYWEARLRDGKVIKSGEIPLEPIFGDQAFNAAFEAILGFIPILGEAQDYNDLTTGVSITGDKLDLMDRSIAGVALILPFVGAGTLRGGVKSADFFADLSKATGRSADEIHDIFKVAGHLQQHDMDDLKRIVDATLDSGKISARDAETLNDLAKKLEDPMEQLAKERHAEISFKDVMKPEDFNNDPWWIERLQRAEEFDIGGYHDLTSKGQYGRVGDNLDSDEVIQNLFFRESFNVSRHADIIKGNPAVALSPEIHRLISNLKKADIAGMSAREVLQHHLRQMWQSRRIPPEVIAMVEREAIKFIEVTGLH